ncbi:type II secretion system protein [Rahnella sp. SAP-1]|jgi:general secretion pathway protein G|uniref:Type II secretion system protein n=1 Tax=Rouxiella aceris TaxID=2703884 RepID=A0A848MNM5_9GAMM|nr:type II secretion system protein [Rouxiella aceris]NMP29385.1 type II secretion system protein [Rouxiella aceris]
MSGAQKGFTLIEMMVTLALLATLAAAALPTVEKYSQRKKEQELQLALRQIRTAIDRYYQVAQEGRLGSEKAIDDSGYPKELSLLEKGVVDVTSPHGAKIYFLRRIPRDPMCDCEGRSNEETWRIRSSKSEPGNYDRGKDVYDVASGSTQTGLNGVPYAQW